MPLTDTQIDRVRRSFGAQTMMTTFEAVLTEVSEGCVTIAAPVAEAARQQQGFGHAALTFGLGDTAAGFATLTTMAEGREVLTTEMKINLLAPAMGDRIIARGQVLKPGRRLVVAEARVYAQTGDKEKLIAVMLGTMIPVDA